MNREVGSARRSPGPWAGRLWTSRGLIRQLLRRDLSQRYRGSFLGIFWSLLTPLATLLIYTFVFSVVLKAQWRPGVKGASSTEYAFALFSGLIPFNLFSEVVSRSPGLILGVPNYVKKVVFPLEVLPVVALLSALVHSLIGVLLLVILTLFAQGLPSAWALLLPFVYVPLVLLCLACGWFLSSLGLYVRDIGQAIPVILQFLMFLSAVVYPVTAVPERYRFVLEASPLTAILEMFRDVLIWGRRPPLKLWIAWTAITGLLAATSYFWFLRTKKGFPDVL